MADVFGELLAFWKSKRVEPAIDRATKREIKEWEIANCACLPDDLREYVLQVNGILRGEQLEFDHGEMSFLPLKAMVLESKWSLHVTSEDMFVFADELVQCSWWCAHLTPQPRRETPIYFRGAELVLIANSLEEFLRAYMSGDGRIYPR